MPRVRLPAALVVLATAVARCSGEDTTDPLTGDISAIEIMPSSSTLTLTRGMPVQQMLRVSARHRDGSVTDETSSAQWSLAGIGGAGVVRGLFTATSPGGFTVTAVYGALSARAQVTVRATGDLVQPNVGASAVELLGRDIPASAARPTIAYPLEGAIFPSNFGDTEIHVTKTSPAQSIARVTFSGTYIELSMFARCESIPNAPDGCAVTVDPSLVPSLVAASEGAQMNLRVRLAAPDGANLVESEARDVRWAAVPLTGALYYWSTRLGDNATAIYRYNLETARSTPEAYFLQTRDSPTISGQRPCVGCHAISRDGRRMALAFGGSDPANFGLYDVATRRPVATRLSERAYEGPANFGSMSALSPDGARLVTVLRGVMTLRRADESLASIGGPLFATGLTPGDRVTQPYWSSDGSLLAFVGWNPSMYDCNTPPCGARQKDNGDLAPYGQIYTASVTGDRVGEPRLIAPRSSTNGGREYTSHYPSISDDTQWIVFNRVRCDAPSNGQGYAVDRTGSAANCSGYDNPGARVMLVPVTGGAPIDLARLNGDRAWTNSWPRWAPNHGRFRGTELYWVAYSSKRPYGLRFAGDATGMSTQVAPQLWFSAVTLGAGDAPTGDPSHAPVWMPRQNLDASTPSGNHVPQWVAVYVPTPG